MDLKEAVNLFIHNCRIERNLSNLTMAAYKNDLKQFRAFTEAQRGSLQLINITKVELRAYLEQLSSRYKPKSIKRKIATLKTFFTFFEQEDHIQASPFRKLKLRLCHERTLPRNIPILSLKSILQSAHTRRDESQYKSRVYIETVRDIAVLELLFSTGIRVSELCSLTSERVDLKNEMIQVTGKGKRERAIPICSTQTIAALKQYEECYSAHLHFAGAFFLNRDKRPLSDQSVRFLVNKHKKLAGVSGKVTPHMFRHTIATLLLENGADIRNIQTLLGHSSLAVTEIYTHISLAAQREALGRSHPRDGLMLE